MAERHDIGKRLSARDHGEAYDLWARHYHDPALMANRDAKATRKKLLRVASLLPVTTASEILDVGPGDGALFRILSNRVAHCTGIDPSEAAVTKLRRLHGDLPNVVFEIGSADAIPYPDGQFDVVVINSVLQMLPARADIESAMRELVRVCKPDGTIFVGELPFRSELGRGILRHLARKLYEYGAGNFLRLLLTIYVKPVLRGEPMLTYPAVNLYVPAAEFVAFCESLGLTAETIRHQELRRPSTTRNDYLLCRQS